MTLLRAGAATAAAVVTNFVSLGGQAYTSPGSTTVVMTSTHALAAGAVAVAVVYAAGANVTNFRDSVDSATAWTSYGANNFAGNSLQVFKRIVPAGGFTTSTTFTATMSATSATGAGIIVNGFTDATSIPTTTDVSNFAANAASASIAVSGTSVSTSYQVLGTFAAPGTLSGPDAGSNAGWTLDRGVNASGGSGIRSYWRKATNTSSATLNETENSSGVILAGWVEVAL